MQQTLRYIEIFRSSLSEVNSVLGYSNRRSGTGTGMYNSRPSPYDRGDRFGNSNRFQSRGSRNFKGANFSNNSSDYNNYDRSVHWSNNGHNSGDNRGRSPYDMDSWGDAGQTTNDRGSNNMHCVHMRGLPFKATVMDVADFFKPIVPVNVRLLQDHSGRASGEADVEFASHDDAVRAMSKDKGHMQHRYIELFLNSSGNANDGAIAYGGLGRRRI